MNRPSLKTKFYIITTILVLISFGFFILRVQANAATNAPANTAGGGSQPQFFGEGSGICAWIKGFYDFGISIIGVLAVAALMAAALCILLPKEVQIG